MKKPLEHSGKTPIERHLTQAGLLRPRIRIPEFPHPEPLSESSINEEDPDDEETYGPASVIIPKK